MAITDPAISVNTAAASRNVRMLCSFFTEVARPARPVASQQAWRTAEDASAHVAQPEISRDVPASVPG
jgi:hypothetical protein